MTSALIIVGFIVLLLTLAWIANRATSRAARAKIPVHLPSYETTRRSNEAHPVLQGLDALLETVNDEDTFVAFVDALARDFALEQELEKANPSPAYGPGAMGWENGTVDAVLEAAARWGRDKKFMEVSPPATANPWRRCAHILYAGKFYE